LYFFNQEKKWLCFPRSFQILLALRFGVIAVLKIRELGLFYLTEIVTQGLLFIQELLAEKV
jgi:hypothetical protein